MQEVEPVLMLNANLLFAVLILIAQPHCTAPGEYHIIANVRHRVVNVGPLEHRYSTSFQHFGRHVLEAAVILEQRRSEEHTSELQSLMRISYAVFCLKKKKHKIITPKITAHTQTTDKR